MECPKCGKDTEIISEHKYPCKCGDSILVEEHVCFVCGVSFDVVDDEIIGEPLDNIGEVYTTILPNGEKIDHDEIINFLSNLEKEMELAGSMSMSAMTHNCLKCGELSFDNGDGLISCATCGFDWEVISN